MLTTFWPTCILCDWCDSPTTIGGGQWWRSMVAKPKSNLDLNPDTSFSIGRAFFSLPRCNPIRKPSPLLPDLSHQLLMIHPLDAKNMRAKDFLFYAPLDQTIPLCNPVQKAHNLYLLPISYPHLLFYFVKYSSFPMAISYGSSKCKCIHSFLRKNINSPFCKE